MYPILDRVINQNADNCAENLSWQVRGRETKGTGVKRGKEKALWDGWDLKEETPHGCSRRH